MNFKFHETKSGKISELIENSYKLEDTSDILDVIANASSRTVLLHKSSVNPEFFNLSSRFAGEVLQKVSNYNFRLGIIGDLNEYSASSKSLRDFIYESNRTGQVIFTENIEEALKVFG